MKLRTIFALLTVLIVTSACSHSGHRVIVAGSGTKSIAIIDAAGEIEWEHKVPKEVNDISMISDSLILYSHQKEVIILDLSHKVRWNYKGDPAGEIQSASLLDNGNILLMQNGASPKIIEVTRGGEVAISIDIEAPAKKPHRQFRNIRKTKEGTYLVPYFTGNKVCEYDGDGKKIRTINVPGPNFLAVRLDNGNTMVACGDSHRLVEFDKDDNVVWEITENELPGNTLFFVAGFQILRNGNIVIANWGGHGHLEKQAQIIEVTRDKEVVWSYKNWERFKALSSVQVLSSKEDRLLR